ncbi:ABC transporter ATP-binding protein [Halosolutus amylolyticus]|uniref:Molybdate/tungstate import ATP-binding protein WtpC n=1 Tax=Halosolutus amylolyticus TaxID=2932267 RepID=A0ABD5PJ65_9EURY|nr:betaine/proline/choline family ABC transporter ATP-binding protein [Halosolutus amylolyticus]
MIELSDVTKEYPDGTVAVDGISFEVPHGETASLVGPSGCGKTTTMTMINRLTSVSEGDIYVDGDSILEVDPIELRRNVGYVIQEIGLFDHMTVEDNIGIVPDLIGWDEERIDERVSELLELIRLPPEVRNNYPGELSGGQRQRVGVARALAANPEVILMDEPFGALDPITREELQDEFLEIQKGLDVTIVFVTHDIDEAIKMGDRVAVLRNGELVQYDTPKELLRNPVNQFVEDFIGEDRLLKQLQAITVRDVMRSPDEASEVGNSSSVAPDASLKLALQRLLTVDGGLRVVSDSETIGVVNQNDIRAAIDADPTTVIEGDHA